MKKLLLFTCVFFLCAVFALRASKPFIEEKLKMVIAHAAGGAIKGKVTIEKVTLHFGLHSRGSITGLIVAYADEKGKETQLLSVKEGTVSLSLKTLARTRDPLRSIEEIHIKKPAFFLHRAKNGAWNINRVIPPGKEKKEEVKIPSFVFKASLEDGTFRFLDEFIQKTKPVDVTLSGIKTQFDASLFPLALVQLHTKINNSAALSANAHVNFEAQQFSAHVSLKDQELAQFASLVSGAAPVSLLSGTSDAEFYVESAFTFKEPQVFGALAFHDVSFKTPYISSPLQKVQGNVSLSLNGIVLHKIKGNINRAPFVVGGKILNLKNPQLEILAAAEHVSAQEFKPYLPKTMKALQGQFNAVLQVMGPAKKPRIAGDISHASLSYKGSRVSGLAGSFSFDTGERTLLAEASAKIQKGAAQLSLITNIKKKPSLALIGSVQNIPVAAFRAFLPASISGANGNVSGQGLAYSASPLQASAIAEMQNPSLKEFSLDRASGGVVLSGNNLFMTPVVATKGSAVAAADGEISGKTLSFNFHTGKTNIAETLARKNMPVKGNLLLEGSVSGALTQPSMETEFLVPDLSAASSKNGGGIPLELGALTGQAKLQGKEIHFPSVKVEKGDSSISFSGKVSLSEKQPALYGKIDFSMANVEQILDEFFPQNPLQSGGISGTVQVAGPLTSPVASGTLSTTPVEIYGEQIPPSTLSLALKKNLLRLSLQSAPFGSATDVTGDINIAKQTFTVEARTKDLDINLIKTLSSTYETLTGKADASVTASGTFSAPKISGSVNIPGLTIEEEALPEFAAQFSFEGKNAALNTRWGTQPSLYEINASVSLPDKKQPATHLEASGNIEKGKLFSLLNLIPRKTQNFTLQEIRKNVVCDDVSSKFSLNTWIAPNPQTGKLSFQKASGAITTSLTGMRANKESLGDFKTDLSFKDDVLYLNQFELRDKDYFFEIVKDANQGIDSRIDLKKGELNLKARIQNLNLHKFAFLLPQAQKLSGTLNATAILSETVQKPDLIGVVSISNFAYADYALDSFSGGLKYKDDVFDFNTGKNPGFKIKKGEQSVTLRGRIPYIWSKKEFPRDVPFAITLDAPDFELAMLKDVSKTLEGMKGKLKSIVTLKGTLNDPELDGSIELSNMEFKSTQVLVPVRIKTLAVTLEKDSIILNTLEGNTSDDPESKDITFSGKGALTLNLAQPVPDALKEKTTNLNAFLGYKFSPKIFNVALQSKNMEIRIPNFSGQIDSSIMFRGTPNTPDLNADVKIHHATYALVPSEEQGTSQPSEFFKKLGLFTRIAFGEDTTVYNTTMKIETKGEFTIQKSSGNNQVKILGEITSNKGIMTLVNKTFRVKEAIVFFDDPLQNLSTLKPTLYARAETMVEPRSGCRVAVTYVIDMRLDKKALAEKGDANPFKDPEYDDSACLDKKPGGPLDKKEVFDALIGIGNIQAGGDTEQIFKDELGKIALSTAGIRVLDPLERRIAGTLQLSEFHVDRDTANNLKLSLAKTFPFPIGNKKVKAYFGEGLKLFYDKTFSQDQNQNFGLTMYFKPRRILTMPLTLMMEERASYKNTKLNLGVQYKF